MEVKGNYLIKYTEENALDAIRQIYAYEADLGQTNIASAMELAVNMDIDQSLKKRVILVTDG